MTVYLRKTPPFQGWNQELWEEYLARGAFFQEIPHYDLITEGQIEAMEERAKKNGWRLLTRITVHSGVVPYVISSIWEQQTQWFFLLEDRCLLLEIRYGETAEHDYRNIDKEQKPEEMKLRGFLDMARYTCVSAEPVEGELFVDGWNLELCLLLQKPRENEPYEKDKHYESIYKVELPGWDNKWCGGMNDGDKYSIRMKCLMKNDFVNALSNHFWEVWLPLAPGVKKTPFPEIHNPLMDFYGFPGSDHNRKKEIALIAWQSELELWKKYREIPGMMELFPHIYGSIFNDKIHMECWAYDMPEGEFIAQYWDEEDQAWKMMNYPADKKKSIQWSSKIRLNPLLFHS